MLLSKYTIELNGNAVQPLNHRLTFAWAREANTAFYRRTLRTELLFAGADFALIRGWHTSNPCQTVTLSVSHADTGFSFTGSASLAKTKFDFDNCTASLQFDPADDYACLDRLKDLRNNLLLYGTQRTVKTLYGVLDTITCFENRDDLPPGYYAGCWDTVNPYHGDTSADPTRAWRPINHETTDIGGGPHPIQVETVWGREKAVSVTTPPGGGWVNIGGNDWVRPLAYASTGTTVSGATTTWAAEILDLTLPNARTLGGFLSAYFTAQGCLDGVRSNFLGINPTGPTPANIAYTTAAARIPKLAFFQKSDVVKPLASDNASLLEMSLTDLFQVLAELLNMAWSVELDAGDSYLRLEHVSYYELQNGPDWTATQPHALRGTNSLSGSDDIPKRENFFCSESKNAPFLPAFLEYSDGCAKAGMNVEHAPTQTTTDIGYICENLSAGLTGIVLAACYESAGQLYLETSDGYLNAALSWGQAVPAYWRHGRYIASPTFSGGSFTAISTKKLRKQGLVSVPLCSGDFDPAELQKTGIGWGEVETATWDTFDEILKLELKQ